MSKYMRMAVFPSSLTVVLYICQTLEKAIHQENLVFKPLRYDFGQFPTPKYYDQNEKMKRRVVISHSYTKG